MSCFFFFQAEDGIRDLVRSRGLGDVYKRQVTGPEKTFDRRHAVVAPEVLGGRQIFRTGAPGARSGRMRALSLIHI